jgi:propanediol dehydratase large subunit
MKKAPAILFLSMILCTLLTVQGSTMSDTTQEEQHVDSLVKLGQRKIPVNIVSVGSKYVYYHELDNNNNRKKIERDKVQRIIYHNGNIDVLNDPVMETVNEKSWRTVLVTEDKDQVEGLYKIGKVTVESSSGIRNIKAAKRNAEIRLQKKAIYKGGNVVYVTKAEAKGGFGDIPGYLMEGVIYSFSPPPETEE